jgi:hypothetical protein
MLSIFTLGAQRMAIDPALPRAGANPGLTCASVLIEEIPAMAIPPRAAPVVLRKSLLLDIPTTPFGISIVDSLNVLAFSPPHHTLFWRQFKCQLQRFCPPGRPFHIAPVEYNPTRSHQHSDRNGVCKVLKEIAAAMMRRRQASVTIWT